MTSTFIAIGIVILVVGLYIASYAINQKTDVPEECRDLVDTIGCGSCTNGSCGMKEKLETEKKHVE